MAWTAPRTWVAGETLTAALLNTHIRDNQLAAFPTGSLHYVMQAETSVETTINGFLLEANGASVNATTYSALNTVMSGLSYPFGGDGAPNFTLPDVRGRALMNAGSHVDMDIGDNDGIAEASRRAKHQHGVTGTGTVTTNNTGAHTHGTGSSRQFVVDGSGGSAFAAGSSYSVQANTGSNGAHDHTVSRSSMASGLTVGTGMDATDAFAHIVCGVWGVKY